MTAPATIEVGRWRLQQKPPVEALWFHEKRQFAEVVEWVAGRAVNGWLLKEEFKFHEDHRPCWILKTPDAKRPGEFIVSTLSDVVFRDRYEPVSIEAPAKVEL